MIPHKPKHYDTQFAFMLRYFGQDFFGINFDEGEISSLQTGISALLPVSSASLSLKQLSLLKLMSNFETGEEFDAFLNNDDGNIESVIAKNVYEEVVLKSKQLPVVAPVDDKIDWDIDLIFDWFLETRHYGIIKRDLQVIVDRITSLYPFAKKLEVVQMQEFSPHGENDEEFRFYLIVKDNSTKVNVNSESSESCNKRIILNNTPMDCWTELAFNCSLQELRRLGINTDDKAEFSLLHATSIDPY